MNNVAPTIVSVTNDGPVLTRQAVTVTITATDPGSGDVLTYEWDWDDDGTYEESSASNSASHTYALKGTYSVGVRVRDDDGGEATGSTTVTVLNRPVDADQSEVRVNPAVLPGDDQTEATVTIILRDAEGQPIQGVVAGDIVVGTSPSEGVTLTPPTQDTGSDGQTTATLKRDRPGRVTVTVQVGGVTLSDQPTVRFLPVLAYHLTPGLHLLGVPLTPLNPDPALVFAGISPLKLARWRSGGQEGGYVYFDPEQPDPWLNVLPGRGFWLEAAEEVQFQVSGEPVEEPVAIPLESDWNLSANPLLTDLDWDLSRIDVLQNGETVGTLANFDTRNLVEPFAWIWDAAARRYRLIYDNTRPGFSHTLRTVPVRAGMWLRALQSGVALAFRSSSGRAPRGEQVPVTAREWGITLRVQAGGLVDEDNVLGVSTSRALEIENPPVPLTAGFVDLSFVSPHTRRANLAVHLRAQPVVRRTWWEAVVTTDLPDTEVILTWERLNRQLPGGLQMYLMDLETGKRVAMRTRAAYTFRSRPEGLTGRRFVFQVEPVRAAPLTLSLRARATRSRGAMVELNLSSPAQVRLEVVSLTGGTVKTLPPRSAGAGTITLFWDGTDNAGRCVPNGMYLVRAWAENEEGEIARAVVTLAVH